jgi:DNA-binding response OmpR family regulator
MAKILLIEPDRIIAGSIRDYFANAKHEAIVHNELQHAIAAADKIKPSAVIMELQLAGRSGIEFLYEFRSYPDWQDLPVIIFTALKKEELSAYSRVLRDLNASRILYKPETTLSALLQALNERLAPVAA